MRSIMYHNFKDSAPLPYLHYLSYSNFCLQLDYFKKHFGFVEREEWDQFVQTGEMPEKSGKVVLTFDDNYIDHYKLVFKEFKRRNLWGIFYISGGPYLNNSVLDVHKIQLLCASVNGQELLKAIMSLVSDEMIEHKNMQEYQKNTYTKQNNGPGITESKRILNYFINYGYREDVVSKLCKIFSINPNLDSFYLSKEQIIEMEKGGMIIGSQAVNHNLMRKLNYSAQHAEIFKSFDFLYSGCNLKHKTYCHPFGGSHSFNNDTINALEANNVDYSFSVESRQISKNDILYSKHQLPRYDCNEFPFGKC
jgi:peptidoglycan/xylan/chitin deacetylase (PgdA/CDA1 family)